MRTESNYYLDRLISDLANGIETIIKRDKGQSNLAKAASPAHWRFGLQSWNPHVGGTGRLNGSEITQLNSTQLNSTQLNGELRMQVSDTSKSAS